MLGLALALSLTLQSPPPSDRITLIFAEGQVHTTVADAEAQYAKLNKIKRRTLAQEKWHAALTAALGTRRQDVSTCPDNHVPRCETLRGRRLPLQSPNVAKR